MLRISVTNFVASAQVLSSSAHATYIANNVKKPQRPFYPWRSTVTTESFVVFDFGAAKIVDLLALIHANFVSVTVQGHATNEWTSPSFSQEFTLTRNPLMWRYQMGVMLTGFNYRFMRLLIPSQTPVDSVSYFSLGGVWAGAVETVPRHYETDVRYTTVEPRLDVGPAAESWRQRLKMGEPYVRMNVNLQSLVDDVTPLKGDELHTWLELRRKITAGDFFALFTDLGDPSQVYIMRQVNWMEWGMVQMGLGQANWDLEEVTAV